MHHEEFTYAEVRILQQEVAGRTFKLATRPALPGFAEPAPASLLVAATIELHGAETILVMGDDIGTLTALLAATGAPEVHARADTVIAKELTHRTLKANGLHCTQLEDGDELPDRAASRYDLALILAPPQRDLARRWLCEAQLALRPGGRLYLAGANRAGIQPIIGDAAALFGNAGQVANRARQRVALARRSEVPPTPPGWAQAAGIAAYSWYEFDIERRGQRLAISSRPGIFSYDHLDAGSAMLLDVLETPPAARVLDIACGYGILGLLATKLGADRVDLSDVSFAAAAASRRNIVQNSINNARVVAGDGLDRLKGERYDLILCNPPFHSGKQTSYAVAREIISQAHAALNPGGTMMLVANRFLPYEQELRSRFTHVQRLAGDASYVVWVMGNR